MPDLVRIASVTGHLRGRFSPNDTKCDRRETAAQEKPGDLRRRASSLAQDWSSSSSMKDGSSSSACLALVKKSTVSAMISQP